MNDEHVSREELRLFLLAERPAEEHHWVKNHLRDARCVRCLFLARELIAELAMEQKDAVTRYYDESRPQEERLEGLGLALEGSMRRALVIDAERELAPELIAELERRSPAARREAIRTAPRFQLFGLAEGLGHASRDATFQDVARAIELGRLAVEVADALDPAIYLAGTWDARALAHAYLGNAFRVASDLFAAEQELQAGSMLLDCGTQGIAAVAELKSLLGSLRIDQARYREARQVLEESRSLWHEWGETREEGKVLIQLGLVAGYSGRAEKAVKLFARAADRLGAAENSRLRLHARHNLAFWLVEAGESLEALAVYEKARDLYDDYQEDSRVQLRRRWLLARIHAGLGDVETAREAFEEVRAAVAERELPYEHAMVSLDLAILLLDDGDAAAVRRLAEEMVPIFRSRELHGHALAALTLFRHAAETETASVSLPRAVARYLERSRNNPYLRFEAPRELRQPQRAE